jgi:hypothetical protein
LPEYRWSSLKLAREKPTTDKTKTPTDHTGQDHRTPKTNNFFFSPEGVPVSIKQEQKEKLL